MKRGIIYSLILASLFFAPVQAAEIAKLEPIQAVWVYQEQNRIILETDTEDMGEGATVAEALADMKQRSTNIIYLDTAEFLLVSARMQQQIPELKRYLKNSVRACLWDGQGSVKEAAHYMDAHKIGCKLGDWEQNGKLPNLTQ